MKSQPTKTVIEMPIEQFDRLIAEIYLISEKIDLISNFGVIENTRITVNEFAEQLKIGKTKLRELINGSHKSGFVLRTFRKKGTRTIWTIASEVDRYFDGFGYFRHIPSHDDFKPEDVGLCSP